MLLGRGCVVVGNIALDQGYGGLYLFRGLVGREGQAGLWKIVMERRVREVHLEDLSEAVVWAVVRLVAGVVAIELAVLGKAAAAAEVRMTAEVCVVWGCIVRSCSGPVAVADIAGLGDSV